MIALAADEEEGRKRKGGPDSGETESPFGGDASGRHGAAERPGSSLRAEVEESLVDLAWWFLEELRLATMAPPCTVTRAPDGHAP